MPSPSVKGPYSIVCHLSAHMPSRTHVLVVSTVPPSPLTPSSHHCAGLWRFPGPYELRRPRQGETRPYAPPTLMASGISHPTTQDLRLVPLFASWVWSSRRVPPPSKGNSACAPSPLAWHATQNDPTPTYIYPLRLFPTLLVLLWSRLFQAKSTTRPPPAGLAS